MKRAVPLLAMLLVPISCRNEPRSETPQIEKAWVRLPAVPGRPGAAYFVLRGGAREARLERITSPRAGRIEAHGPGMRPLGPQSVPAGGQLVFAPGGHHAMVYDLRDAQPLSRIGLTFHFDSGREVTVRAPLVPAGLPEPEFVAAARGDCEEGVRREGDTVIATHCAP